MHHSDFIAHEELARAAEARNRRPARRMVRMHRAATLIDAVLLVASIVATVVLLSRVVHF